MRKSIKRLVFYVMLIVMAVVCMTVTAGAAYVGYYYYSVDSAGAIITDVNTTISGDVTIPSTLGGYPVTSIGDYAFEDCTGLKSITIPDSVTSIGDSAFSGCTSLTSITIPDSVTSIGEDAFSGCTGLTSITIPDSVTSIGGAAFYNCTGLTSITLPFVGEDGTYNRYLGFIFGASHYYYNYSYVPASLKEVIISDKCTSVTSIGAGAFYNCTGLTSITIPDSVTSIGDHAFSGCTGLTSITIGNSVTSIGGSAFSGCTSLTSITIPDSVTSIGGFAFSGCTGLTSITIPDSVTSIGGSAFLGCTSLTSITIPDSVTSIGNSTFSGCTSLTSITIPDSVTSISFSVFVDCTSLKSITIPDSVTSIGGDAFDFCTSLESITIPDNVTSIGASTFSYCKSLKSITIPDSVTSIGDYAFCACSALKDVYYTGTKSQWKKISVGFENDDLTNATVHYNYGCIHSTLTTLKAVAATCTKTGKTAGKKCSVCGEITVAQKTVAKKGHTLTTLKAVAATCTKTGKTAGKKCSVCGTVTVAQKTVARKAHTYKDTITKATLTKNGKITRKCSACGYVASKVTTIYAVKSVKLSTYTYTYAGKVRTPVVTVKDSKGNTLKKDTDYTVKYATGRKMPGKYTVTITFKGKYSGKKTLSFKINPAAPKVTKATSTKKGIASLTWSNVTGETGYEVYFSTKKSSGFKKLGTYKVNVVKATKSKLTSGKTYYFKVRAYKTVDGSKLYSSWSAVKAVKIK